MRTNNKIWVSVDGGGTKTMFCAGDSSGKTLYAQAFGRANYKSAGLEAVSDSLTEGFETMLKKLNRTSDDVAGMVMAIAGCDTEQDLLVYRELITDIDLPPEKVFICNDTESIFHSLTDEAGICVVAGTGSIVCAYDEKGLAARTGGWGAALSDLGSGYWIGSEILKKMICWLDGMEEKELPVYHEISEKYRKKDVELAWTLAGLSVSEIASVSLMVFRHADLGDTECMEIVGKAAEWIVKQITVLCKRVHFQKSFPVVAVGGLFNNKTFFDMVKEGVTGRLAPAEIHFIRPVNSPAEDGLNYARKLFPE